jgi:hypothetical protein
LSSALKKKLSTGIPTIINLWSEVSVIITGLRSRFWLFFGSHQTECAVMMITGNTVLPDCCPLGFDAV